MTSREGRRALDDLRELMSSDLSKASPARLADGVRSAEQLFDDAQEWSGRLVAELRTRGEGAPLSWAQLSKMTGVPPTTLRNRVAKAESALQDDDG